MTFLFIGGEEGELSKIGNCTVDTTTAAARRAAYSRCSLKVTGGSASDGWYGALTAPTTVFWLTARNYGVVSPSGSYNFTNFIGLLDGVIVRLIFHPVPLAPLASTTWRLSKINAAGTLTTLQTSGIPAPNNNYTGSQKIDVYVNYAVSGSVKIYFDGIAIIDYSGDVTTDSATTLSRFSLGNVSTYYGSSEFYYSEIIASTLDTRSLSLATLPPLAAGNASSWTGTFSDVNETSLADATLVSSATANQISEFTVTKPTALAGTLGVAALVVNARAQKGSSGPQNLQLVARTGGADYVSSTQALGTSFAPALGIFELNPATSAPWTTADLNAVGLNIGVKSIT